MKLNRILTAAFALVSSWAVAADKLDCQALLSQPRQDSDLYTTQELLGMSSVQLDEVYSNGTIDNTPTTDTCGTAVFAPGLTGLNNVLAFMAGGVWQGKTFNSDGTRLLNKVGLGWQTFEAEVYKGQSWFDGAESIIIDYSRTSVAVGYIRDEIREVSPNLYLGRAYLRTPNPQGFQALFFILKTPSKN